MASGPTFFSDAQGSNFYGPVNNVAGNIQHGPHLSGMYTPWSPKTATNRIPGLDLLRSKIARHANYDVDQGAGPTRCDEDTRVAFLDESVAWAEDPNSTKPVLWMNGAAGVGKSSIA